MNDEGEPMSESNGRAKRSRFNVFLPLGIVFLVVAIAMIFLGTNAWIAFFSMAVTFLILSMQNRTTKNKRQPGEDSQD
jgi:ABC-type phosphate transport system permease subunit